jgi:hypothetical protein
MEDPAAEADGGVKGRDVLNLIPVEPEGVTEPHLVFVDGHGFSGTAMERIPVYPLTDDHKVLKRLRQNRKAVIRSAAEVLGLTCGEYSSLERGSFTLTPREWSWAHEVVRGLEFREIP